MKKSAVFADGSRTRVDKTSAATAEAAEEAAGGAKMRSSECERALFIRSGFGPDGPGLERGKDVMRPHVHSRLEQREERRKAIIGYLYPFY